MMRERHLVIFTRFPVAGAGKRRLAASVGAAQAVRFQRVRLANLIRSLAGDRRWRTWLATTPTRSGPWPSQCGRIEQGRGDLGTRMARVFTSLPRGSALLIGTDIPGVTPARIAAAFDALAGHDAVFGPTDDGGFWLVGLSRRSRPARPFHGVRWSTQYALADTVANLEGRRVAFTDRLTDVDTGSGLDAHPHWPRLCRAG